MQYDRYVAHVGDHESSRAVRDRLIETIQGLHEVVTRDEYLRPKLGIDSLRVNDMLTPTTLIAYSSQLAQEILMLESRRAPPPHSKPTGGPHGQPDRGA